MALPIVHSNIMVDLQSSPINSDWIQEGDPVARKAILSRSHDGMATTLIWDCTPGKFEWHYDTDETIHILEGAIVLDDGNAPPRRLGPGDVVFFPQGAVVRWSVETHVRKLAFFRRTLPKSLGAMTRAIAKLKSLTGSAGKPSAAWAGEGVNTTAPAVTNGMAAQ